MTQRIIEINSPAFVRKSELITREDFRKLFHLDQPLALEIGCGTGHFVTQMAERHPETNFLAIDIYNKGCFKTCKKIDLLGLTNIRVIRIEACYLLANYLTKRVCQPSISIARTHGLKNGIALGVWSTSPFYNRYYTS